MEKHTISKMDIEFNIELFSKVFPEMSDMIVAHYDEIAAYKDKIALKPDTARYLKLEDMGVLKVYTVRHNGKLIGYSLYFVDTHLHYSEDKYAANDILFLLPEYRIGRIALTFIAFCEVQLRELGVAVISIHMKTYASFERLCEYAGYDFMEKIYTKCIKE